MKSYLKLDPWKIIEEGFHPELNRVSESIFSIGNGRIGQRANFEERYTGQTLQGNYVGGIYYPDRTRVGWWKNGYPEYFAKVLNAPNWIGIDIDIDGIQLDLAEWKVEKFRRVLHMREGYLERSFTVSKETGLKLNVNVQRIISLKRHETGAVRYSVLVEKGSGRFTFAPYIDADVLNEDANYGEKFWREVVRKKDESHPAGGYIVAATKKTDFHVGTAYVFQVSKNGVPVGEQAAFIEREQYVGHRVAVKADAGDRLELCKYAGIASSLNHEKKDVGPAAAAAAEAAAAAGFPGLLEEQAESWRERWRQADIVIEGDEAAQQGIRFNIFQLYQTYTGDDERLNIGPKGFTGEKYGGSTYWDTEAYCLPFYLATAPAEAGRKLLLYRYRHLPKAIENAARLGFTGGAALYPMVTMNGEECHNEWEITFEEIHRNGAIAFAIYYYCLYTGDYRYLADYGLEVLIGISRFWVQRVHWSEPRGRYVMHGVTGPNEYENNVNNNWYTNTLAVWCLKYSREVLSYVKKEAPEDFHKIRTRIGFDETVETKKWQHVIDNMYLPFDEERRIFLQQDGYLEKEQKTVAELDPSERPLNQHWSWDRILRSVFIKQADVLQGIFLFESQYDTDTIRRNFDFYEARTVHESSLSPCIHSILASRIGDIPRAYELYLRTSRLDLDDYNNEAAEGCHITSMAGTWMSVVMGFGGMRVRDDMQFRGGTLHLNPILPAAWTSFSFRIRFRNNTIRVTVDTESVMLENESGPVLPLMVYGKKESLPENGHLELSREH